MAASYSDSTSCVKNNCNGHSTVYSSAIPSHPLSDISDEVLDSPELEVASMKDFVEVPNEAILEYGKKMMGNFKIKDLQQIT